MSEDAAPVQRILVGLDASPHSRAALTAAVQLAQAVGADIEGLFVEDEALLRTAQLPFAEEVRAHTVPPKQLTDRRLQRQLRYRAEHAEHALQQAAADTDVAYDFHSVRGKVTRELLRATDEADLLVLGKTSTKSSRRRLGSTSRTVLAEAASSVLVLRQAIPRRRPILLYYDGSDAAEAALPLAARLARSGDGRPLTVLLPDRDDAKALRAHIQQQYADLDVRLRVHRLTRAEQNRLSTVARQNGGLVLLPADCVPLDSPSLQQFLYELNRPLLLVR